MSALCKIEMPALSWFWEEENRNSNELEGGGSVEVDSGFLQGSVIARGRDSIAEDRQNQAKVKLGTVELLKKKTGSSQESVHKFWLGEFSQAVV